MPFKVVKGAFHVRGYSPDGDSIRFEPDDIGLVHDLEGRAPGLNPRGHVQLRLEAIDTLETHFTPGGGGVINQPVELAHAAADRLLEFVGITDVVWNDAHTLVTDASDGTRGYILARTVEKNGRPVAFVYAGDPPEEDGSDLMLEADRLRESYNFAALAEGLAYPTYYRGLFSDLREALTAAAEEARSGELGIYASDRTVAGFRAAELASITRDHVILPKLFRRLSEYMVNFGTAVGFKRKLEQSREPVLDLRTSNFTHFDTFVEQEDGNTFIRLTRRPEELVFDEMPTRPSDHFADLLADQTTGAVTGTMDTVSAGTAQSEGEGEFIRDLMLTSGFSVISPDAEVSAAREQALKGRIVIVRASEDGPLGILTGESALRLLGSEGRLVDHFEELQPAGLVSPEVPLANVLRIALFDKAVSWFVAVEGENVAGVVPPSLLFQRLAAHRKAGYLSFVDPVPPPPTTMCYCCPHSPRHAVAPKDVQARNVKGQAMCPVHKVPMTATDPCSIC
jgi:hypothetical protein